MASQPWPFYGSANNSTSKNQLMMGYLVRTKAEYRGLNLEMKHVLMSLGIEIGQRRDENEGLTMVALGERIGLDPGCICILENGKMLPQDITQDIRKCLFKIKKSRDIKKILKQIPK